MTARHWGACLGAHGGLGRPVALTTEMGKHHHQAFSRLQTLPSHSPTTPSVASRACAPENGQIVSIQDILCSTPSKKRAHFSLSGRT